jgi:16S rRNA pseudouridine516 synthase
MAKERIDKILSNMGLCSRREAAKAAKSGQITVNGQRIKDAGQKADPETEEICLRGQPVAYQKYTYLMLNKKAGYITATEDKHQATVLDLLPEQEKRKGLFAAGRLDKDTEGLLILTNDGAFAHSIMSPRHHIDKVYYGEYSGELAPDSEERFREGLVLSPDFSCMPAELKRLEPGKARITIREGKFHQVKRMIEACGGKITYLKRLQIGTLKLPETLKIGDFCPIEPEEVKKIQKLLKK